jgi:peptidyl-tRNA hydrolase, PTH1 family
VGFFWQFTMVDDHKKIILIVGLGNPGAKYENNRHNIGFHLIDAWVKELCIGPYRNRFQSEIIETTLSVSNTDLKLIFAKPQTFMNLSGQAVSAALQFYKLRPEQVIVYHDELDLTEGRFRCKLGGGNAGHNGLKSITAHIGPNFVRGRMGIGHPGDKQMVHSHVLSDFTKAETIWAQAMIAACIKHSDLILKGEREAYQNEVMRTAPAPKPVPPRPATEN